jgi:hypothetical protein
MDLNLQYRKRIGISTGYHIRYRQTFVKDPDRNVMDPELIESRIRNKSYRMQNTGMDSKITEKTLTQAIECVV